MPFRPFAFQYLPMICIFLTIVYSRHQFEPLNGFLVIGIRLIPLCGSFAIAPTKHTLSSLFYCFTLLPQQHLPLVLHFVILDSFFFRTFQYFTVSLWPVHLTNMARILIVFFLLLSMSLTYIKNNETGHHLI